MYYIGILTGAFLLIGALLLFGFGRQEKLDSQKIVMKIPILGTISTRSHMFAMAMAGFALMIVCMKMAAQDGGRQVDMIHVDGKIESPTEVTVYFVAVPDAQYHFINSGTIDATIPSLKNAKYKAEFVVGAQVVHEQALTVVDGHANLEFINTIRNSAGNSPVMPNIEVSDAAARAFLKQ